MDRNTMLFLIGLGGAYFFLKSRQPVFIQNPMTGAYQPASLIDSLTSMVTGIQPPVASQPSYSVNIPGLFNATYNPTGQSSISIPGT